MLQQTSETEISFFPLTALALRLSMDGTALNMASRDCGYSLGQVSLILQPNLLQ